MFISSDEVNVGDANFRPSLYKKQYLSNGQDSSREISHKHCKIDGFSWYNEKQWLSFSIHKVIFDIYSRRFFPDTVYTFQQ